METTYTVKAKNAPDLWVFKYHLNGIIKSVEFLNCELSEKQRNWLYRKGNFPDREEMIKDWQKNLKANFEIIVNMPELSFDDFWKLYPYNKLSNKKTAKERFDKLKPDERIKLFMETPNFIKLKKQENQFFPYCEVYIRGRWWDK